MTRPASRPSRRPAAPLDAARFARLDREYRRACGLPLSLVGPDGRLARGGACARGCARRAECGGARRRAVEEALRWGEPSMHLCPAGRMAWAVPLLENQRLLGGLVAFAPASGEGGLAAVKALRAARELLALAERHNATNAALLQARRQESGRERARAEAIHAAKAEPNDDLRTVYLREEPGLLAAVRGGDRPAALSALNRVLVGIYHAGRDRPDLLKSCVLELVVLMCRAAVEAGAEPAALLGRQYRSLAELSEIDDEERLCAWLTAMLDRLMDGIRNHPGDPNAAALGRGLAYLREHLARPLGRDEVARAAGLSPSHFSRLVREHTGRTFTELLGAARVERACALLRRTSLSALQIGVECGFDDPSYFTKVFRRHTGRTPRDFRRRPAADPPA